MDKKKILLSIAICLCLVACILLLLVKVFDFDIIKHSDARVDNFTIKYYGDFSSIHSVKIYDGGIRRGTFELDVEDEIIARSNEIPAYLQDINKDGHNDILIPHSLDEIESVRYAVYHWNNDSQMFEESPILKDLANIKEGEDNKLFSSMKIRKITFHETEDCPEVYELHFINQEFVLIDGNIRIVRDNTLIYYPNTDAYCYTVTEYDTTSGEIVSSVDDWLNEEEASIFKNVQ